MPNANLIELETSMASCLSFCEANKDKVELAAMYHPRFERMISRYHEAIRASDHHHAGWQAEQREETVARKQISDLLRRTQQRLHAMGAIGFPNQRLLYWDFEELLEVVDAMQAYLAEHSDELEFASEVRERFGRLLAAAQAESQDVDGSLKRFQRFVDLRRAAINEAGSLIGEFRVGLRRTLGKTHPLYQGIYWPYSIASDENMLF
jgi:hypothetical protein